MRIGLQGPRLKEQISGGATFEQELFSGLLAGVRESGHTLVVYSRLPKPIDLPHGNCVEWIRTRGIGGRNLCASFRRIINHGFNAVLHLPSPFRSEHWIDRYVRDTRVEFFLSLIPETLPTETPYMTFVWDLMHRVHPYFPECSQRGAWVRREAQFERMIRRASIIAVGTGVGKTEVTTFYQIPEGRVHILPYPTPTFALTGGSRTGLAQSAAVSGLCRDYLLLPASFHAHKNHVTVLHALTVLRDRHGIQLQLVLTGGDWGNLNHIREVTSRLGLEEQVYHLGFVNRRTLVQLYHGALALVFPSLLGPDNIPPLEAFGLGCPAIVADIPGASEQLGEAALLFPPTDEVALAQAILKLRSDPELRRRLITLGRARAAKYTSSMLGADTLRLIGEFEKTRRCWSSQASYPSRFNIARLFGG